MRTNLVLVTCVFVNVWLNQDSETLFVRWQRYWTANLRAGACCRIYDVMGRWIKQTMIESLKADSKTVILDLSTTPKYWLMDKVCRSIRLFFSSSKNYLLPKKRSEILLLRDAAVKRYQRETC